jgi:hypothetical protein
MLMKKTLKYAKGIRPAIHTVCGKITIVTRSTHENKSIYAL